MNQVIIIGRAGADPVIRYTPEGKAVLNVSVATSDTWKGKEGDKQEKTEWHNITAWGPVAERCAQSIYKGTQVFCQGKVRYTSYTNKSGQKIYKTSIEAFSLWPIKDTEQGELFQKPAQESVDDIPF